jgi:hypothetical protein
VSALLVNAILLVGNAGVRLGPFAGAKNLDAVKPEAAAGMEKR